MPAPIRIALLDDRDVIHYGLKVVFGLSPQHELVSIVRDIPAAIECAAHEQIDVFLVDVMLEDASGLDAIAQLRSIIPNTKFVVFTAHIESEIIRDALKGGASGYLVKNLSIDKMLSAINAVVNGRFVFSDVVHSMIERDEILQPHIPAEVACV